MANGQRASMLHLDDDADSVAATLSLFGGKRGEFLRLIIAIAFGGLVQYFAVVYGMRERLAVIETKQQYQQDTLNRIEQRLDRLTPAPGGKP